MKAVRMYLSEPILIPLAVLILLARYGGWLIPVAIALLVFGAPAAWSIGIITAAIVGTAFSIGVTCGEMGLTKRASLWGRRRP